MVPSDSAITPVLLSVMRSHPEKQELLVLVYGLLAIVASQGGSACSRGVLGYTGAGVAQWPRGLFPASTFPVTRSFHKCARAPARCQAPPQASRRVSGSNPRRPSRPAWLFHRAAGRRGTGHGVGWGRDQRLYTRLHPPAANGGGSIFSKGPWPGAPQPPLH